MVNDVAILLKALHAAAFTFRVAVFDGHDPEMGPVLEAHAFDVPEELSVAVSFDLTKLVRRAGLSRVALAGVFDEVESPGRSSSVPRTAAWYEPTGRT